MIKSTYRILLAGVLVLSMTLAPLCVAKNQSPTISNKKITISIGGKYSLKIRNKGGRKVVWSSSHKRIASVNKKGVVTGKKGGTARITARLGKKTLICKVTVIKKKKNVKANPTVGNNTTAIPVTDKTNNISPTQAPDKGNNVSPTQAPDDDGNVSPTRAPDDDGNVSPTQTPDSITDNPQEDESTRDEGWVPGWY